MLSRRPVMCQEQDGQYRCHREPGHAPPHRCDDLSGVREWYFPFERKHPMKNMLMRLWYENANGDQWEPGPQDAISSAPAGFVYQHSRFPCSLRHQVLDCSAGSSVEICAGQASWTPDLVQAMTRPSWSERMISVLRTGRWQPTWSLSNAISLVAGCCEGCLNVLVFKYGLANGYDWNSPERKRCGTSCELCAPDLAEPSTSFAKES